VSGALIDLGNAERFMLITKAAFYSGGAARLAELECALRRLGQGQQFPLIERNTESALARLEMNHRQAIDPWRAKVDIFNKWKSAVIEQMTVDGAVAEAIAQVDCMMWVEDEVSAADPQHDPVGVRFDRDAIEVDDGHDISLSDGSAETPSATKAGGASSAARQGGKQ
jgi:hypothetical protein